MTNYGIPMGTSYYFDGSYCTGYYQYIPTEYIWYCKYCKAANSTKIYKCCHCGAPRMQPESIREQLEEIRRQ